MVAPTAIACVQSCPGLPKNAPLPPAALTLTVAKRPVASAPQIPPIPWTANTSSVSSTFRTDFNCAAPKQAAPAPAPISNAPMGLTKPDACLLYTSDAADDLLCVDLG